MVKKEKKEGGELVFFFFCGVICFFINYLWLVPKVITGDMVKRIVDVQSYNCRETMTEDGDILTADQCRYFQDVLNGKYNESEKDVDIESFITK